MNAELLHQELNFRTARSGGKGGQNVNKVETKVEALFEVEASNALDPAEKALVFEKLASKISAEGILAVISQTHRSQFMNKSEAAEKLVLLVEKALIKVKRRKATKIPESVVADRLKEKKHNAEKKSMRRQKFSDVP